MRVTWKRFLGAVTIGALAASTTAGCDGGDVDGDDSNGGEGGDPGPGTGGNVEPGTGGTGGGTGGSGEPEAQTVTVGPRPYFLIDKMEEGDLKDELLACADGPFEKSTFSIGHRGAALQFPEHTKESYEAAARTGAGILECDVTFTKDKELVCRHSQCDLHTTTDILLHPTLAAKCTEEFTPADGDTPASATCSRATSRSKSTARSAARWTASIRRRRRRKSTCAARPISARISTRRAGRW